VRYHLNPNCAPIVKHDIEKLFARGFIKLVEEVTWLSPITIVPKKERQIEIFVDLKKLNVATKKNP
jgi:hypothetical protein